MAACPRLPSSTSFGEFSETFLWSVASRRSEFRSPQQIFGFKFRQKLKSTKLSIFVTLLPRRCCSVRPSKVWCNSTRLDVTWVWFPAPRHKVVGKNPGSAICYEYKSTVWDVAKNLYSSTQTFRARDRFKISIEVGPNEKFDAVNQNLPLPTYMKPLLRKTYFKWTLCCSSMR